MDEAFLLVFETDRPPDELLVRAFAIVDDSTGEPVGDAIASYMCRRSGDPRCALEETPGGVTFSGIPSQLLEPGFVVIFASWVGNDDRQSEPTPVRMTSSWLVRTARSQ